MSLCVSSLRCNHGCMERYWSYRLLRSCREKNHKVLVTSSHYCTHAPSLFTPSLFTPSHPHTITHTITITHTDTITSHHHSHHHTHHHCSHHHTHTQTLTGTRSLMTYMCGNGYTFKGLLRLVSMRLDQQTAIKDSHNTITSNKQYTRFCSYGDIWLPFGVAASSCMLPLRASGVRPCSNLAHSG